MADALIVVEWSLLRRVVTPAYLILRVGRRSVTRHPGSGDGPSMEQLVAAVFFDGSLALGQPPECSVAFRYDDGCGWDQSLICGSRNGAMLAGSKSGVRDDLSRQHFICRPAIEGGKNLQYGQMEVPNGYYSP